MGFLLRASLGFAIAFALYAPQSFAAHLPMKSLMRVKAELAVAQPGVRLRATLQVLEHHSPRDV